MSKKNELNEDVLGKVTGGWSHEGADEIRNNVIYSTAEARYISAAPQFLNQDIVIVSTYSRDKIYCGTLKAYKDESGNGTSMLLTIVHTCPASKKGQEDNVSTYADSHRICAVKGYK